MPVALPPDADVHHNFEPDATRAYNVCRNFEEHATDNRDVMHARILGYLIIYSPSLTAQREVVKVIHSCGNDHPSLSALGSTFLNYFIRPFMGFRERTPAGSSTPSPLSFDKTEDEMPADIKGALQDYAAAKHQAIQALIRDGYRCTVTREYDISPESKKARNVTKEEVIAAGGGCITHCVYIVPDSVYLKVTNPSDKVKDYSASVLAIMKQFGYDLESVDSKKVHSLYNVMTMELLSHYLFDHLELWFEETTTPNCYNIHKPEDVIRIKDQVTFTTPDPVNLPLPSPHLLALHAACAQVAHLSGAGEYIDLILTEMEEMEELTYDGTSSEVLHHALMTHRSQAGGLNI